MVHWLYNWQPRAGGFSLAVRWRENLVKAKMAN